MNWLIKLGFPVEAFPADSHLEQIVAAIAHDIVRKIPAVPTWERETFLN